MDTTEFIWMDGELKKWDDSSLHILNHSLHYGSAVFEGIRCYETSEGTAIFRLDEHVKRLFFSAKVMRMSVPFTEEQIKQAIIDTVKANKLKAGYIRPLIYYGYGKMGLSVVGAPVKVSISMWPWGAYLGDKPVKVKITDIIRLHPKSSVMGAKVSGHYSNSILAGEEARESGFQEALLLDYKGYIAEGPGENFFIVKQGHLITPRGGTILEGITRDSIMKIASDMGIEVEEKIITKEEAYFADEAFFTGTAAEVSPIGSIDKNEIRNSPGPITSKIKQIYSDTVRGKVDRYKSWLTIVNL